jgi:hypothetical protein
VITEEEAKAIVRRLGKPILEFAASIAAPLYWPVRNAAGTVVARNGTAFFLRTKQATFGVTAAHVIEGRNSWRSHCDLHGKTPLRLGGREGTSVSFDWDARAVDINSDIDIATFTVSPREIEHINRTVYSGFQTDWPPEPPKERQGIIFAGFPAVGTRQLSLASIQFGVVCGTGLVSSVSELNVSSLIDRDHLEPALGEGMPPENFDFGGISGAPMLYVTLTKGGLFLNSFAGVIFSGPNTSDSAEEAIQGFELIRARRARFIREDGFLDHSLWRSLRLR